MRIRYLTCGLIQLLLMGFVAHATAETRHLKCTTSLTGVDGIETPAIPGERKSRGVERS